MSEEPQPVSMLATCHTPGCLVEGVTFTVDCYPNATAPVYRAQCGRCGQTITDLVPAATA